MITSTCVSTKMRSSRPAKLHLKRPSGSDHHHLDPRAVPACCSGYEKVKMTAHDCTYSCSLSTKSASVCGCPNCCRMHVPTRCYDVERERLASAHVQCPCGVPIVLGGMCLRSDAHSHSHSDLLSTPATTTGTQSNAQRILVADKDMCSY